MSCKDPPLDGEAVLNVDNLVEKVSEVLVKYKVNFIQENHNVKLKLVVEINLYIQENPASEQLENRSQISIIQAQDKTSSKVKS